MRAPRQWGCLAPRALPLPPVNHTTLPFSCGLRALPIWGSVDSHRPIPPACRGTRGPGPRPAPTPRLHSTSQGAHFARCPGFPRPRGAEETEAQAPPGSSPGILPRSPASVATATRPPRPLPEPADACARVPRTRPPEDSVPTLPSTHRGACAVTSRRGVPARRDSIIGAIKEDAGRARLRRSRELQATSAGRCGGCHPGVAALLPG